MTRELRTHLRWLADTYESVQSIRLQAGERIRAVAQGRTAGGCEDEVPAARTLAGIRNGRDDGPVPVLGQTYRVHWIEERRLRAAMADALDLHPAWPWLRRVKGIGPTLAAKLLSRVDISRAPAPSSFWSYCGLATVPGAEYVCSRCGTTSIFPADRTVSGGHVTRGGKGVCSHRQEQRRGPRDGVRAAQPRARTGEAPVYDRYARRVCYQIGCALLRAGGAYAGYYAHERDKLETARAGWTRGHHHMAALRKTEKLLLAHLWVVWAEQASIPSKLPYAFDRLRLRGYIDPAAMVVRECR